MVEFFLYTENIIVFNYVIYRKISLLRINNIDKKNKSLNLWKVVKYLEKR